MLSISNDQHDPYFNIASEEFLLKNFSEDVFMLYINRPSIIVGKHQNAFSEINYPFIKENHIPVIRRLSGGGSVYHDTGNLNFTFIVNSIEGKQINFKRFTNLILEVLQHSGVPAVCNERNDILINGLKCSGNAEHIYKNRTLHHGTLLFSSDLNNLRKALKGNYIKYEDKAVKSISSHVTNISEYLPGTFSIEKFRDNIVNYIHEVYPMIKDYLLSEKDNIQINKLVKEKYQNWDWNYGYSPGFKVTKSENISGSDFELRLEVKNGLISGIGIYEKGILLPKASELLIGAKFKEDILDLIFQKISNNAVNLNK